MPAAFRGGALHRGSPAAASFFYLQMRGLPALLRLRGWQCGLQPEMVSSGIAAMDALTGGLPRGCLTEICGPASSGRTTLLLAALAAATRRGEFCALVDASDALDPQSAVAAGVELDRLLWVRCGENSPEKCLEQLLRATDLLLESGGFGLIALDLGDLPPQAARRIPLTTWFRFRRAVEHTPTVLLAVERQSIAGSCSSLLIKLGLIKLWESGNQARRAADAFSTPSAHTRAIADRTGNHGGVGAIPAGSQTGSLRRDHIRQQNCLGGMKKGQVSKFQGLRVSKLSNYFEP